MKIEHLINREFTVISVLEDLRDVSLWLHDHEYLIVLDEENKLIDVFTLKDLHDDPGARAVLDCNFLKPNVQHDQSAMEVLELMKSSNQVFLPVFERDVLIGVISLFSVAAQFAKDYLACEQNHPHIIIDPKNTAQDTRGMVTRSQIPSMN